MEQIYLEKIIKYIDERLATKGKDWYSGPYEPYWYDGKSLGSITAIFYGENGVIISASDDKKCYFIPRDNKDWFSETMKKTGFGGNDLVSQMISTLKLDGKPFYLNGKPAGYVCTKGDVNSENI